MLKFATKPDTVFTSVLENSLDLAIDNLRFQGTDTDIFWLDDFTIKLFGNRVDILLNEMQKILAAHIHADLFMPTDYHFLLLDRALSLYCDIYNDSDDDSLLIYKDNTAVQHLDIDSIRSTFFYDTDYELLDVPVMREVSKLVFDSLGMSPSGKNIQKGNEADLSDLTLEKCTPDTDWDTVDQDFWFD